MRVAYNSVLAMRQLTEFADCVLPIENASLARLATPYLNSGGKKSIDAFSEMNRIVANVLSTLTAR